MLSRARPNTLRCLAPGVPLRVLSLYRPPSSKRLRLAAPPGRHVHITDEALFDLAPFWRFGDSAYAKLFVNKCGVVGYQPSPPEQDGLEQEITFWVEEGSVTYGIVGRVPVEAVYCARLLRCDLRVPVPELT